MLQSEAVARIATVSAHLPAHTFDAFCYASMGVMSGAAPVQGGGACCPHRVRGVGERFGPRTVAMCVSSSMAFRMALRSLFYPRTFCPSRPFAALLARTAVEKKRLSESAKRAMQVGLTTPRKQAPFSPISHHHQPRLAISLRKQFHWNFLD